MEQRFSNKGGRGTDRGLNPSAPLLFARLEQYFSSIGGAVKGERLENNLTAARQTPRFLENKRASSSGFRDFRGESLPSFLHRGVNGGITYFLLLDFREILFYGYPVKSKRLKL